MSQPVEPHAAARNRAKQPTSPARLTLVPRPGEMTPPAHTQIWHGDADMMSPAYTSLSDWPTEREFVPFVKAAFASGDAWLVEQLRRDREYCAAMRRQLRREAAQKRSQA